MTRIPSGNIRESRLVTNSFLWFPAILILILYAPALGNGFVWDDDKAFFQYPYYRDVGYLLKVFSQPLIFWPDYYRPLTSSTFILQIHFFGLAPYSLHLVNILLHVSNTIMVGLLARKIVVTTKVHDRYSLLPLFAAIFYASHPALIESISWISDRFDLLVTFFLLLTLLLDSYVAKRILRAALAGITFFLATLSKEMALALVCAIPFWHLAFFDRPTLKPADFLKQLWRRGHLQVYIAMFIAGLLYLGIRYAAIGHLVSNANSKSITGESFLSHLLLIARSYTEYLSLMIAPFGNLSPVHPVKLPVDYHQPLNWLPLLELVLVLGTLLFLIRKFPRTGWLLLASLVALFPIINLIPIHRPAGSFYSESYLVFPMAMWTLFLTSLLSDGVEISEKAGVKKFRSAGIVILALWFSASLVSIRNTVPLWKDDATLWKWASIKQPNSDTAQINRSSTLSDEKRFMEAMKASKKAIEINPDNAIAWSSLGRAQTGLGWHESAETAFKRSIELDPENVQTWISLAQLQMARKNYKEAINILSNIVVRNDPNNVTALINLAFSYEKVHATGKAISTYQAVLKVTARPETVHYVQKRLKALAH
jgi:cytochrome c-type biogenesis protein CcmH/NrfG